MLLDYATGAQCGALAVLVASHLTLCPECRRTLAAFEAVGGATFGGTAPDRDAPPPGYATAAKNGLVGATCPDGIVPGPLATVLGRPLSRLSWRWLAPGIRQYPLAIAGGQGRARLMRLAPGRGVPQHGHEDMEATLLIVGSFHDGHARYRRGDVVIAGADTEHRPVADAERDCVCLAVEYGRLKFRGLARVLSRVLD